MAHVKLMDQARNTYEMFVGKHFENKEFAAGKKKRQLQPSKYKLVSRESSPDTAYFFLR